MRKFTRDVVTGVVIVGLLFGLFNLFVRKVWFYRDPVRVPDEIGKVVIAPCDGQVVYIKRVRSNEIVSDKLGQKISVDEISKMPLTEPVDGWLIGIYMSPLDVHYNYSPIPATIEKIMHIQTPLNLPMVDMWEYIQLTYLRHAVDLFGKRYELENERQSILFRGDDLDIIAVEIADKFVNKISTFVVEGEKVETGQKLSFIERGSQVDLVILNPDIEFTVELGQQVYGGQTVIARY